MEMFAPHKIRVSKNYLWHETANEFERRDTHEKRSGSCYEAKLDVFEDRVKTWFLDVATHLIEEDMVDDAVSPGDYVAISIALAYIEGVERYRQGRECPRRNAGAWFKASVRHMLTKASEGAIDEGAIDMLWESARCGLAHAGFTTDRVYLSHDFTRALELTAEEELHIDPVRLVQLVRNDFEEYVQELRTNPLGEAAKKFLDLWNERWENS